MFTGWIFSSAFFLVLRSLLAKLRTSIPARTLYHGFQSTGPTSPFSYFSSVSPPEQNKPLDITFYDLGNINYLWLFYGVGGGSLLCVRSREQTRKDITKHGSWTTTMHGKRFGCSCEIQQQYYVGIIKKNR